MQIPGSHLVFRDGYAKIDRQLYKTRLTVREIDSSKTGSSASTDTLSISDEARALAAKKAEAMGLSESNRGSRVMTFIRQALESQLGGSVGSISVDDLEISKRAAGTKFRIGNPNEMPQGGLDYRYKKVAAKVELTAISIQGTAKTKDGKEFAFTLQINIDSSIGSARKIRCLATGQSAANPPVLTFDGFSHELTKTNFSFDLNPLNDASSPLSGYGTFTPGAPER